MPRRFSIKKEIPRGRCKQKMGWKCLLRVMLLLTLFIKEVELHGIEKRYSNKMQLEPWEDSYYCEQNHRHFHSKRIDEDTIIGQEDFRRRKPRVGNTNFPSSSLQGDSHRRPLIKGAFQPVFADTLANLSVARGRNARFQCVVDHLGGYKVGWVKVDTKAIQAIHNHVVTHNTRVSVSHSDHATWYLLIKNVEESDRGMYMCQVNTDPMIYQTAFLEILHSPDLDMFETSSSVEVQEGSPLRLKCKPFGRPKPNITWHRENNIDLNIRDAEGNRVKVKSYEGEVLELPKMMRSDMGDYMCNAYNGVPPTIRKTIRVTVRFHPMIQVPNQLVGAPLGTDITLVCYAEAYPTSISYWFKEGKVWFKPSNVLDETYMYKIGEIVFHDKKYEVDIKPLSSFELNMTLKITNLTEKDMGSYSCVCKNPVGEVSSQIRVYEITDDRSSYRLNKGRRGSSTVDAGTKKPGKPVKLLRPANIGNSINDYNPKESRTKNRGQQCFPCVYYFYIPLIFYFAI